MTTAEPPHLEALLDRLRSVTTRGRGWKAKCPAHDDEHPSLDIDLGTDGTILLRCRSANCTAAAIVKAVGLDVRDLFPPLDDGKPREVASYPYKDEHGRTLYEVVRFEPKDFRQRKPDGHGGHVWKLNGTRRVPYRLEHFRAAGELLLRVKSALGHGELLPWIRENVTCTVRRAQQLMALAKCAVTSHSDLEDRWRAISGNVKRSALPAADLRSVPDGQFNREYARRKRERLERRAVDWRRLREAEAARAARELPPGDFGVIHGDFRKVAEGIADNSVALLLTDPPYSPKALPLFADLGRVAARVLAPGGSMIVYCGHCQLPGALDRLREHLTYWSTLVVLHTGQPVVLPDLGLTFRSKLLLWFCKGRRRDLEPFVCDLIDDSRRSKHHHEWEQSPDEALRLIGALTAPGDLVADFFAGSGTTLAAAKTLHRKWIGSDTDEDAVWIARKRLAETNPAAE
jgi:hypothetical protein